MTSTHEDKDPRLAFVNLESHPTRTNSDSSKSSTAEKPCEETGTNVNYGEEDLPPTDGGVHAWLFLLASAMLEALVWGEF